MEVTSNNVLRQATLPDATDIARIHVTAWQAGYAGIVPDSYLNALSIERHAEIWRTRIEKAESELWLIESDGGTVGWIAFGLPRAADSEPHSAEIYAVYVAPTCWSRGMGRALLSCAFERLSTGGYTSCHLWVLVENVRARRIYELAGFSADLSSLKLIDIGTASLQEIRYRRSIGTPPMCQAKQL